MAAETNVLSIPVRMDTASFREFSAFDVLTRQKRWRRPLLFAVLMAAFAIICFTQVGRREGAALLGTVLAVIGVGLPIVYFATFFQSVNKQAKQLKLETPRDVYRVELSDRGVRVLEAGKQDKQSLVQHYEWAQLYGAWRTSTAVYIYVESGKAYLLTGKQIPGGLDAAWKFVQEKLPAEKQHIVK